ncbi:MAG: DUF169 domain-containing protein [Thermodesulfobacteriota bacterium]
MELNSMKALSENLRELLVLHGHPVAIKMVEKPQDLAGIHYKGRPVRRLDKNLIICQLMAQARFYGRVIAGEEKHLNTCRLGADALGFQVDDYTHVYAGTYFTTEKAARNMIETMPKFERGRYQAVVVAPLDRSPAAPDVVVIFGNAAQMMRIVNAALHDQGGRLNFSASGDAGLCADILVQPLKTNQPHIAIPCNGGRLMSLPNETDLACGIPFGLLGGIVEGLEFTRRNVPIMYPTAWQHIDWEPPADSPIVQFLRREKS